MCLEPQPLTTSGGFLQKPALRTPQRSGNMRRDQALLSATHLHSLSRFPPTKYGRSPAPVELFTAEREKLQGHEVTFPSVDFTTRADAADK